MRAVGRAPKVLYFILGMKPTKEQAEEAANSGFQVAFRNALLVDKDGNAALEECDGVMGEVPPRYAAAFPGKPGETSGVGAIRDVHDGEPGVSENQPLHMNSTSTGDPVEEERRRAARGLPVNAEQARPTYPTAADLANKTLAEGAAPGGPTNTDGWSSSKPLGKPGAAQVSGATLAAKEADAAASVDKGRKGKPKGDDAA